MARFIIDESLWFETENASINKPGIRTVDGSIFVEIKANKVAFLKMKPLASNPFPSRHAMATSMEILLTISS